MNEKNTQFTNLSVKNKIHPLHQLPSTTVQTTATPPYRTTTTQPFKPPLHRPIEPPLHRRNYCFYHRLPPSNTGIATGITIGIIIDHKKKMLMELGQLKMRLMKKMNFLNQITHKFQVIVTFFYF